MSQVQFSKSTAQRGSLLFAESLLNESILIENSSVFSVINAFPEATLVHCNAGSLTIRDTTFDTIESCLFNIKGAAVSFSNVSMNAIQCQSMRTSCILQGQSLKLEILDSKVQNVLSNTDLFNIDTPSPGALIHNINVSGIIINRQAFGSHSHPFVIYLYAAYNISITHSSFTKMYGVSALNAEKSSFQVLDTKFINSAAESSPQLSQSILQVYQSSPTQFILSTSSNGTIQASEFIANSQNSKADGGVSVTLIQD